MNRICHIFLWGGLFATLGIAQQASTQPTPAQVGAQGEMIRPTYVLGPDDQIAIRAFQVDEIGDRPFRIDTEGDINVPVLGKIHAAGQTVDQLEAYLLDRLKVLVKNPQVSVSVVQYRSEPVFVQGAFQKPGIYPLQGRRTLLEMLAAAGGLLPNASRKLTVTRRLEFGKIPLASAKVDTERNISTLQVSIERLRDSINPVEDIVLQPMDVISVERAEMIYVNGEVMKAGAIELGERDSISVTQLLAMVGGMSKDADATKTLILRPVLNTSRRAEIPINLKKILAGGETDFPLLPNDVLYVPKSHKLRLGEVGLIAIPLASGLIYVLASKL